MRRGAEGVDLRTAARPRRADVAVEAGAAIGTSVESADPRGGKCRTCSKFESRRRCLPEKSNRPTPGTTSNPAIEQGGCPGGVRGTRAEPRVRPLNNYRHPKFPRGVGALSFNSSMCRPSFRPHFQQPPRPPFVGVSLRTEQCRLQPTLRRRPLP